ncbi:MAG TPA: family 16 glycoside hydrolase [Pirellulales bacterium]|nr:family 16 glycoside hydrolase [Pirellulales bacterium]
MTAQCVTCPPDSVLSDFGLGKLDATSAETVSQHLEACADCRQRVAGVSGDSFVGRLKQAGAPAQAARRERTYVPGESLANAANSTDGSSAKEDGLPRPSTRKDDRGQSFDERDGLGSPSSPVSAPPELANHPDYELIKELGRGGMGTVYLARNRMMDRMEVLKVISKSLLAKAGALERFQQEIRSAAKLAHPNIVGAYSVLRPGELLVFAMEYVKGQDLEKVVNARGYLPVANAAFYIHQVAQGLQHAHEKGMVHRDIKPNNLMLAIEGKKHTVKILDFGLAKASSEKGAEAGLTKSGQMLGTPDFIAPEQTLDAHKADIRADIYSLGCTLYFLLSGGPPFQEQSLYAILEAHHKREPKPLNLVRPDVPVELAMVVSKMMAKDPTKRYQTPVELAKALVPFFKQGQNPTAPAPQKSPEEADYPQYTADMIERPGTVTPLPLADQRPLSIPVPVVPLPLPATPVAVAVPSRAEEFSVTIDTHRSAPKRRGGWSSLPPWQRWSALGGAAAALLLGVVLLVRTPKGTVKIELSDRCAQVTVEVDGDRIDVSGLGKPLSLQVGDHDLTIKGDGYETITRHFKVTHGNNVPLSVSLVPTPNERGGAKGADGFVSLFDGKTLEGWKPHPSRQGLWRVEKGILIGSGPATSYLFSDRGNYTNFHLRAETRVNDGGNGGVFGRSTFGPAVWLDGYEAQINSTVAGPKTGSIYGPGGPAVSIAETPVRPNEWFTLDLIAIDNHIVVKINGQKTGDYVDRDRRFPIGHIALQQHDPQTVVEFRKIEIKELQSTAPGKPPIVPDDAQEFGGHWYKFYQERLSWKGARDRCKSYGGHLVIIGSMEENAFVGRLVEEAAWQDTWIGATDEAEEGKWRDVNGELPHFTNWAPGQPNNKNDGEEYALMTNRSERGTPIAWRWCDQPNESKQHQPGFVCEWEPKSAAASATQDNWIPLFNGKDLTDWYMPQQNKGTWQVVDGHLVGRGGGQQFGPAWLATKRRDFSDFQLRLELVPGGGHLISRAPQTSASWWDGYRVALWGAAEGELTRTGSISKTVGSWDVPAKAVSLPQDYYVLEIHVSGKTVTTYIEGTRVAEFEDSQNLYPLGEIRIWCAYNSELRFRRIEIAFPKSTAPSETSSVLSEGDSFFADNAKKVDVKTLASGLQYKVLKSGSGPSPKSTDTVQVRYRGTLTNGHEFDSSYGPGSPASFPVTGVIKGWQEALPLMKVGDQWQLFVPPNLAYGEKGVRDKTDRQVIPPNATLIFEVELLDIKRDRAIRTGAAGENGPTATSADPTTLAAPPEPVSNPPPPPVAASPSLDRVAELKAKGAFGFPQARAQVLCDVGKFRLSIWNNREYLFAQAIAWDYADDKQGVNALSDYSNLTLIAAPNLSMTANVDRMYQVSNSMGFGYAVVKGPGTYSGLNSDSKGRGSIRYLDLGGGRRVRVDSFLVPLNEVKKRPGDRLGVAFQLSITDPRLLLASNTGGTAHAVTLADNAEAIDPGSLRGAFELTEAARTAPAKVAAVASTANGANATPSAIEPSQPSPAKPIDLLKQVDLKQPGTVGDWRIERGALVFPQIAAPSIAIYGNAPAEYTLSADVQCPSHVGPVTFGIVVGNSQALVAIDGYAKQGSALAMINGIHRDNPTWVPGAFLIDGAPNNVEVTVRKNRIKVSCNRRTLIDWMGDPRVLSLSPAFAGRHGPRQLFISMGQPSPFVVTRLTLRPPDAIDQNEKTPIKPSNRSATVKIAASTTPGADSSLGDFAQVIGEVARGFTTSWPVSEWGLGILPVHFGREHVLFTHPLDGNRPCVLTATVNVRRGKRTWLILDVSHHPAGDWQLLVKANGQQLYDGAVGPSTAKNGWLNVSLDLTRFAGKQVNLELQNKATGWRFEHAYWGKVQIVSR